MTAKRFTLFDDGETIFDNETVAEDGGKQTYWVVEYGQRVKVVELLNELHEENEDRFNEQMYLQKQLHNTQKELEPIRKICKKYRIPIKDLPEILEEYIAYDNDDEW